MSQIKPSSICIDILRIQSTKKTVRLQYALQKLKKEIEKEKN